MMCGLSRKLQKMIKQSALLSAFPGPPAPHATQLFLKFPFLLASLLAFAWAPSCFGPSFWLCPKVSDPLGI